MKIRANGIDIEVEDTATLCPDDPGVLKRPVVMLIMGLGMQLIAWPPDLVQGLVDAGYRVIRMDNRDIGLSQHFDHLGRPNVLWAGLKFKMGLSVLPPYTLSDMAHDAIGVLDALGIKRAHMVGVSMGGMIAQRVAIAAPKRVLSLTSIMSTSGAKGLPSARAHVTRTLLTRPKSTAPSAVADQYVKLVKVIGSPAYPVAEAEIRDRSLISMQRSYHPVGTLRQMLAIVSDTTRAHQLAHISSPTLVVHGRQDPLVPYGHGLDTARRIPGAKLVTVEGMGHNLPPEPVRQILAAMIAHFKAASRPAARARATPVKSSLHVA
jgi:pimeloyl-ACP methyl ester carboxylesterase